MDLLKLSQTIDEYISKHENIPNSSQTRFEQDGIAFRLLGHIATILKDYETERLDAIRKADQQKEKNER
jgi:hypothetical protein